MGHKINPEIFRLGITKTWSIQLRSNKNFLKNLFLFKFLKNLFMNYTIPLFDFSNHRNQKLDDRVIFKGEKQIIASPFIKLNLLFSHVFFGLLNNEIFINSFFIDVDLKQRINRNINKRKIKVDRNLFIYSNKTKKQDWDRYYNKNSKLVKYQSEKKNVTAKRFRQIFSSRRFMSVSKAFFFPKYRTMPRLSRSFFYYFKGSRVKKKRYKKRNRFLTLALQKKALQQKALQQKKALLQKKALQQKKALLQKKFLLEKKRALLKLEKRKALLKKRLMFKPKNGFSNFSILKLYNLFFKPTNKISKVIVVSKPFFLSSYPLIRNRLKIIGTKNFFKLNLVRFLTRKIRKKNIRVFRRNKISSKKVFAFLAKKIHLHIRNRYLRNLLIFFLKSKITRFKVIKIGTFKVLFVFKKKNSYKFKKKNSYKFTKKKLNKILLFVNKKFKSKLIKKIFTFLLLNKTDQIKEISKKFFSKKLIKKKLIKKKVEVVKKVQKYKAKKVTKTSFRLLNNKVKLYDYDFNRKNPRIFLVNLITKNNRNYYGSRRAWYWRRHKNYHFFKFVNKRRKRIKFKIPLKRLRKPFYRNKKFLSARYANRNNITNFNLKKYIFTVQNSVRASKKVLTFKKALPKYPLFLFNMVEKNNYLFRKTYRNLRTLKYFLRAFRFIGFFGMKKKIFFCQNLICMLMSFLGVCKITVIAKKMYLLLQNVMFYSYSFSYFNVLRFKKKFLSRFIFYKGVSKTVFRSVVELTKNDKVTFSVSAQNKFKLNSSLVLNYIILKLGQYFSIHEIINPLAYYMKKLSCIAGYRILVTGRLTRKERAAVLIRSGKRMPLSTIKAAIDYSSGFKIMKFGVVGIKVYLFINPSVYLNLYNFIFKYAKTSPKIKV